MVFAMQASGSITVVEDQALQLQAYVAKLEDGRGIVSFRGTDPGDLEDWIDDIKVRHDRHANQAHHWVLALERVPCDPP